MQGRATEGDGDVKGVTGEQGRGYGLGSRNSADRDSAIMRSFGTPSIGTGSAMGAGL
jgi:hypothetical protein